MASNSGPARAGYSGPANLTGKVAVVTGGSQGLGEAIARLFAERGAAGLVICGRNEANGARVAAEIEATGCPTFFVRADLESVADCRNVIAEADRRFKRVDVLVNAAGLTDRGNIFDTTEQRFNEIFNVNVRAPFFLIQEAAKIMRREKIAGSIVNIQSMSGPWRPAVHRRLLRLEGRARHADAQCRAFADQVPHPRQRPQYRLDGDAGRGPDHENLSRREGRLARRGRQVAPVRTPDRSQRSRARLRLSRLGQIRA